MKLFFTPQAERQAADMDLWWREHRPSSRDLFARELAEAGAMIVGTPAAGSAYLSRSGKPYRRVLMPRTKNHVYFEVVELVPLDEVLASGGDYLDAEERERLHASIDRGLEDVHAGRTTDARQVMAVLRTRASGR